MTLTDRHLDELRRERWRSFDSESRRYAELISSDLRAIVPLAEAALRRHDTFAICVMGEALIAADALGLKPLRRLGFTGLLLGAEIEERRYEAALKVFASLPPEHWTAAKAWLAKATAEAGLARLKPARESLDKALELDPEVRGGGELMALLKARRELKGRIERGPFGWADLRRLVEVYLELDLPSFAAKLIGDHLGELPDPSPEDYPDGLEIVRAALPLLGPEFVLRNASSLAKVRQDDRLKAVLVEGFVALGRPEEGAQADDGGRDLRLQRALALGETGRTDETMHRLGRHTIKRRKDMEVRAALGFYVGKRVLEENPLVLAPPGGPQRIFNLMPFNDEIALLKIHLAEMADWVDQFVIVESKVTFTGQPKPLHFKRHKHEFVAYADKIRHVVVREHPATINSPWGRDFRQRDMAATALSGLAAPDDLVLLTDVDEIVHRRALEGFEGDLAGLRMTMSRFFLNYRPTTDNFPLRRTGAVARARLLQRFGSSYLRFELARSKQGQLIDHAGWHFTSVCDPARLVAKMNSYAHQERGVEWRDVDLVDERLSGIRAGDYEPGWERAEIDESFPDYVLQHRDELKDLLI
jgi:hypothetical protein